MYFLYIYIILFSSCSLYNTNVSKQDNPLILKFNEVIDFKNINKGDITSATKFYLKQADRILNDIIIIPQNNYKQHPDYAMPPFYPDNIPDYNRTYENTLLKMDDFYNKVHTIWNIIGLLSSVHPNESIRKEADDNSLIIQDYMIDVSFNRKLYLALKQYSKTKDALALNKSRALFLEGELNDFMRSGIHLKEDKQQELKEIQTGLLEYSTQFYNNIASVADTMFIDDTMVDGLPETYLNQRLLKNGLYGIDLSYPSVDGFLKYATSDSLRKVLRIKYLNIASDTNVEILDEIIRLRNNQAHILGYENYASFILEESMAKTPKNVWRFENSLIRSVTTKAISDTQEITELKVKDTNNKYAIVYDWDKYYYENMLLDTKYLVDSKKVQEYFEINNVINGFIDITGILFDITYKKINNPSVWHSDVLMYELYDKNSEELLGIFYMDLFPRENKYQGAAEYTLISRKNIGETYQIPVAALVCNFPKPFEDTPSLLPHDEVVTFFHEFGHLLHDLLSKTELMSQAGTSVTMDFVEAPSQLLENFVWNKESLSLFAKHYKTDEVIPNDLVDKMIAAKNLQSGNNILQQIFYGVLDMSLCDTYDADTKTTTALIKDLQNTITNYSYVEGTYQQASFDHLIDYAASYYGYLWSEVYAYDMYSVFEDKGVLNPAIGKIYRETILEKGGSIEPEYLVKEFLRRDPNNKAFLKQLEIK